jgi:hypothetical protein
MWDWFGALTQGQASFLGSLVGALTGLIALLLGALFNARLNRRRDDRLRREDRRAVATALRAELAVLNDGVQSHVATLKSLDASKDPDEGFNVPGLGQQLQVMPEMVSKFGLLDRATIQSVIEAYGLVEEHYGEHLDPNPHTSCDCRPIAIYGGHSLLRIEQLSIEVYCCRR